MVGISKRRPFDQASASFNWLAKHRLGLYNRVVLQTNHKVVGGNFPVLAWLMQKTPFKMFDWIRSGPELYSVRPLGDSN